MGISPSLVESDANVYSDGVILAARRRAVGSAAASFAPRYAVGLRGSGGGQYAVGDAGGGDCGGDDLYDGGGDAPADEAEVARRACGRRGFTSTSCGADALHSCILRMCWALSAAGLAGAPVLAALAPFFLFSWSVEAALRRHGPSWALLPHCGQWRG